jgi:hypothetical protein
MSILIAKPRISHKDPRERQLGNWQVDWRTDWGRIWYRETTWSWTEAIDVALHYNPESRGWSDPCCPNQRWR